jgi:hypothetical protein
MYVCRNLIFTVAYAVQIYSALKAHKSTSVRTLHRQHIRWKVSVLTLFTWLLWISLARWRWLSSSLWIPSSSSASFFFRRRCGGVLYIFMKPFRGRLSIKRKIKSRVQLCKCPWSLEFSRAKYEHRMFPKSRNETNFQKRDEGEKVFRFEEQEFCKFLIRTFLSKMIFSWSPFPEHWWLLYYQLYNHIIST